MKVFISVTTLLLMGAGADDVCGDGKLACDTEEGLKSRSMLSRAHKVSNKQASEEEGSGQQHTTQQMVVKQHGAHKITTFKNGYVRADGAIQWLMCLPEGCDSGTTHALVTKCLPSDMTVDFEGKPDDNGLCCVGIAGSETSIRKELDNCKHILPPTAIVEQDQVIKEPEPPDDNLEESLLEGPVEQKMWGLDRIDDREGLDGDYSPPFTGEGVHIFIADTGVRTTHKDFGGRAFPGLEASNYPNPMKECDLSDTDCANDPTSGHGTHCAGTAAGNKFGVAKNAKIHALKVLYPGGGSTTMFVEALDFAKRKTKLRPAVFSASLGGFGWSQAEALAVNALTDAGVLVVVAAGNDGFEKDDIFKQPRPTAPYACAGSPSGIPSAITVGAIDPQGDFGIDLESPYSSYDSEAPGAKSCVDIFAPGTDIWSASNRSDTGATKKKGTSMATPHVSGAIALLLEANPKMSSSETEKLLKARATKNAVKNSWYKKWSVEIGFASPNLLLYVGLDSAAPTPSPSPTPSRKCTDNKAQCGRMKMANGKLPCSDKIAEYWLRIHCPQSCGFCPPASGQAPTPPPPTPPPTLPPQEYGDCPFLKPHEEGINMPLCENKEYHWNCMSGGRGGRVTCPQKIPHMCANKGCDGGTDHCCEDSEQTCSPFGGLRHCQSR